MRQYRAQGDYERFRDGAVSDETLLAQAQSLVRESTVSAGATVDGQHAETHLAVNKTWRNGWGVTAYAKTLLAKGKKPQTAGGVEITKTL